MNISIIIPTLNRSQKIKNLLDSVKSAIELESDSINKIILTTIVVDQSEDDKTRHVCENYKIKFIKSTKKGLSLSRNIGIDASSFDYLIFFDDDVVIAKNYFLELFYMLSTKEYLDSFTGKILTVEKEIPYSRYQQSLSKWLNLNSFDQVLSSGTGFSSNYIKDVGKFDECFGLGSVYGGSEEGDLIIRGLINKKRIFYNSSLISYHPEEKGSLSFSWNRFRRGFNYGKGRGALIKKHIKFLNHLIIIKNFGNPLLGFLYNLLGLNLNLSCENLGSFFGRIYGYKKYKR